MCLLLGTPASPGSRVAGAQPVPLDAPHLQLSCWVSLPGAAPDAAPVNFGRLRAAMRPPAVTQPYCSVTGKQPRFKVLHARLLVPMESWALENTWNVLSRMQKEKGEVKNRALTPLVHWHGMAFPFLFCLGREKRKNTKTFSFLSLADETRAGHLAGHSRDLSPLGNRMLPSVVRVSTTTTSRAALRTSTWPHPCSPHQVPQTGFFQLTSGVIFPSAQSKDGR